MEEETISLLSVAAIIISIVALIGCVAVYMAVPEAEANPVTWGAITQYNDKITVIQNDIIELKQDAKDFNFNYDDERLDDIEDDINDLEDEIRDINEGEVEHCYQHNEGNWTEFKNCLNY